MFRTDADALAWLYSHADFERGVGYRPDAPFERGVQRTARLLRELGNPHLRLRILHVAGSKGKGSVCALVAAAARAAGRRTGMYTQPHLHSYRERFQIDGRPIDPKALTRLAARARAAVDRLPRDPDLGALTTFEISTAMALDWFRAQDVDLVVLETGLGGRLDATNVVTPAVTAVTTIAREHTAVLGGALPQIAREKAGIAKPGVPMLVSDQAPDVLQAVRQAAHARGAPVHVAQALRTKGAAVWRGRRAVATAHDPRADVEFQLGLAGPHQARNAGLAYAVCRELDARGVPIPPAAVRRGFGAVRWPARLELAARGPAVVVDGAHTVEAVQAVVTTLQTWLGLPRGPVVFGALRDKPAARMAAALRGYATHLIVIAPRHPRGAAADATLAHVHASVAPVSAVTAADAAQALHLARAACRPDGAVLATGSLAVAADVRAALGLAEHVDPPVPLPGAGRPRTESASEGRGAQTAPPKA